MPAQISLTSLVMFFLNFISIETFGQSSQTSLVDLKQSHYVPSAESRPDKIEAIAKSQFEILKYMKNHPNFLILSEGSSEELPDRNQFELSLDLIKKWEHDFETADYGIYPRPEKPNTFGGHLSINKVFPKGIPNEFKDLSPDQKKFFFLHNADRIALYLGIRKSIFFTETLQDESRLHMIRIERRFYDKNSPNYLNNGAPAIKEIIFKMREQLALEKADKLRNIVSSKQMNGILLLYGANHDFEQYSALWPQFKISSVDFKKSPPLEPKAIVDTINNPPLSPCP